MGTANFHTTMQFHPFQPVKISLEEMPPLTLIEESFHLNSAQKFHPENQCWAPWFEVVWEKIRRENYAAPRDARMSERNERKKLRVRERARERLTE